MDRCDAAARGATLSTHRGRAQPSVRRGGIALFLAAMQRAGGGAKHGRLAREALVPIRNDIREEAAARRLMRMIGLGGVRGYGSIVYALTKTAELLDDSTLLDDAIRAASFIDANAIALDRGFDVVAGTAGCALALLALHRAADDKRVLETALHCGHHILNRRQSSPDETLAHRGRLSPSRFFARHGRDRLRIDRLYGATGETPFLQAAEDCHAYERQLFLTEDGNWPDLRGGPNNTRVLSQWCHGAAGIGLARLGCAQVHAEDAFPGRDCHRGRNYPTLDIVNHGPCLLRQFRPHRIPAVRGASDRRPVHRR